VTTAARAAPGASAEAIRRHYDVGNDFYRLFLDDSLTYSCALFADGDTLATAQARKHDWHVAHAGAAGARRVLDVGCGWGGTLRRLVHHHGVERAVGLTLSPSQHAHVLAEADPRIDVRLESWADHAPGEPYDAIVSIGAFEHFARYGVGDAEKVDGYRGFFDRCFALLRRGGRLSLQTIAYGDIPRGRTFTKPFFATEIFPESELPRLADVALACEGRFEIVTVRNDREDYARTCRLWFDNLRARRDEAIALTDALVVQRYERYLRTFSHSFALGAFQLLRIALRRLDMRPRGATASP
jgi:cyclopropane-fatty-acyl-phospholipid synthase